MNFTKKGKLEENEVAEQFQNVSYFLEDIEFKNMLSEEGDSLVALFKLLLERVELRAVTGQKCCSRMYTMWAEKTWTYKLKTLNYPSW